MLTLNTLSPAPGTKRARKRIGRGEGSGQGRQAGKGHKGQKARSGGGVRPGFEGGQMPLYRRLPKRGFSNAPFRKHFAVVTLATLNEAFKGEIVTPETLSQEGIISGVKQNYPVKIIGDAEVSKSLTFKGISKFSKGALKKLEAAGAKISEAS